MSLGGLLFSEGKWKGESGERGGSVGEGLGEKEEEQKERNKPHMNHGHR